MEKIPSDDFSKDSISPLSFEFFACRLSICFRIDPDHTAFCDDVHQIVDLLLILGNLFPDLRDVLFVIVRFCIKQSFEFRFMTVYWPIEKIDKIMMIAVRADAQAPVRKVGATPPNRPSTTSLVERPGGKIADTSRRGGLPSLCFR